MRASPIRQPLPTGANFRRPPRGLNALLLVALAAGSSACTWGGAPERGPHLDTVTPSSSFATDATSIRLTGDSFTPRARLRWGSTADELSVDTGFRVLIGGVELGDVSWVTSTGLSATVPAGLPLGKHTVRVIDPYGAEASLEEGYEVLARKGPSLSAQISTATSSVQVGRAIEVRFDVRNTGDTAADSVTIEPGAPVGTAQVTFASPASSFSLAPGALARVVHVWVTGTVGVVSLSASARGIDSFSLRPVAVGPVTTSPVDVLPPPFLSATLTSSKPSYVVGEGITLQLSVTNLGGTIVRGLSPLATQSPTGLVTATDVPLPRDLDPSQTRAFLFSWDAIAPGVVTFGVSALGTDDFDGQPVAIPNTVLAVPIVDRVDGGVDAGVVDAGVEDCANRADDNGNGLIDCADPACAAGASCNDGQLCTIADSCSAGACVGQPKCAGPAAACFSSTGCDAGVCTASPLAARTFCDGGQCDGAGRCAPFCDASNPVLRACFQFESGLGDGSQYGNTGTRVDGTFPAGARGLAYDPGAAAVTVRDHPSFDCTTGLTLEAWVRLDALPAGRFGVIDNNGQYGMFIGPAGQLNCSTGTAVSGGVISLGAWHHLACTLDATSVGAFVDGVSVASLSVAGTVLTTGDGAGVHLGENSPSGDVLQGALDGVRVWCEGRAPLDLCTTLGECG